MKLIDLSQPIFDNCPNCPVHPPVQSKVIATHEEHGWRMELLTMASHTGSHVDAPMHKMASGISMDKIPLESFVGEALIADLREARPDQPILSGRLQRALLEKKLEDSIVLIATGWGQKRAKSEEWLQHPPFLSPEAAEFLVERKVRAVGIDHYSIGGVRDPYNSRTHEILLGANMWIVEDLYFPEEVFALPQPVQFWSLPINLLGHSGAFCRPVIVVPEEVNTGFTGGK